MLSFQRNIVKQAILLNQRRATRISWSNKKSISKQRMSTIISRNTIDRHTHMNRRNNYNNNIIPVKISPFSALFYSTNDNGIKLFPGYKSTEPIINNTGK